MEQLVSINFDEARNGGQFVSSGTAGFSASQKGFPMAHMQAQKAYLPAAGRDWALPLYDPFTTLFGINGARRALLESADLNQATRILDIGCGTGTLAVAIQERHPHLEVFGIDPDPRALAKAAKKAHRRQAAVRFAQAFSEKLPFPDSSFERVFSSFMFHHVPDEAKPQMLREALRVLRTGGSLHMLDVSRAGDKGLVGTVKPRGIHRHLKQNSDSQILAMIRSAGFSHAEVINSDSILFRTVRIAYFRGVRAAE